MTKATAEQILGLSGTYNLSQARAAYRELVKTNHPDVAVQRGVPAEEAHRKMADINSAWAVIDRELRRTGTAKAETVTTTRVQPTTTVRTPRDDEFDEYMSAAEEYFRRSEEVAHMADENIKAHRQPQAETKKKPPEHIHVPERPKKTGFDVLRTILNLPLWRLGFLALAFALFPVMVGLPYDQMISGTTADGFAEPYFAWLGLIFAAFANLLTGLVTTAARESCLWLVDKMEGLAPEPSLRYAVFGHLPYRLLFLALGMWQYWDFAMFHAAESGAMDWPLHSLIFLVAGCNFVLPLVTTFIRELLIGAGEYDN